MDPHLNEKDARTLSTKIVAHLLAMGGYVEQFGISLTRDGFTFRAVINGHDVWVRTGQGNFDYKAVAVELLNEALHHAAEFEHPELRIVSALS